MSISQGKNVPKNSPAPQTPHPKTNTARFSGIKFPISWIIAAALLSGFYCLLAPSHQFENGFNEEDHIARHLAHGDGFLSPFDDSAQAPPTSWCPPVYPFVMSLAYRLFDDGPHAAQRAMVIFNILCRAACATGLFVLGRQFFNRNVGALAAAMFLVHPTFLHVVDELWDNCLALATFLWILCWTFRLAQHERARKTEVAALGATLGILLLINTSYVLACPAIVLLATTRGISASEVTWGRRALLMFVAAGAMILVLLPWTIRNCRTFDRLFLVRGNANVELWLSNQPSSTGWIGSGVLDNHPSSNAVERRLVLEEGEANYFALCGRRFADEYFAAPGRFWILCVKRFVYAFFHETGGSDKSLLRDPDFYRHLLNALVIIAGLAGVWTAWRRKQPGVALFGIALLSIAPYGVTHFCNRYAMPLRAMLLVFTAYFIVTMAPKRIFR